MATPVPISKTLAHPLTVVTSIPPAGAISPEVAQSILQDSGTSFAVPEQPLNVVFPVTPTPANTPQLSDATTATQTVTQTGSPTIDGLMAWASANPVPALVAAGLIIWGISYLLKKK